MTSQMHPTARAVTMLAIVVAVAGCRPLPLGEAGASGEPFASGASESGPAPVAVEGEAPEECGFPPGTPLEYAGRSTTAELDVQEVVGDPMSHEPADIYITRDALQQGEHFGRLVCALFVNHPWFVEVTVHPDDGGRIEPTTPGPAPSPPADGVSADAATEIARAQLPDPREWEMAGTEAGPLEGVMSGTYLDQEWARDLPPDQWVWRIFFIRGDQGIDVVLDYLDGSVLGTVEYIVD